MLLEHPDFSRRRVASVTKIGFAGAPMSDGLMQRVEAAFQPELFVNHYGSSEVYTYTIDQHAARKPGSSGRAALNQRIRVVPIGSESPETSAAVGEEGAIVADMAGDEAFEGYWKRPEADVKSLKDGWFFTGDTGYFDSEGDLFVTGRLDDLIITGGENVSPVDVENALSTHPAVAEVAVAGLADEQWGKVVTAFIKRREAVDEQALQEHCLNSGLANFKRPRRYVFVEEIPKSAVGKVLRRELVAERYVVDGANTPS
jgi:2-furoate---CoA ligase